MKSGSNSRPVPKTDYFRFDSTGQGLSVLGWELVDQNNVEVDPRTARLVFPTGAAVKPVTNGPAFLGFGGGWYVNLAPVSAPQGGSLYATQALPADVFTGWFGQPALVPLSPMTGTLKVGAVYYNNDYDIDLNTDAPGYAFTFSPITSEPPTGSASVPPADAFPLPKGPTLSFARSGLLTASSTRGRTPGRPHLRPGSLPVRA
jgi:hypothetical protein